VSRKLANAMAQPIWSRLRHSGMRVAALAHRQPGAHQDRGYELPLHRLAVDLVLQELDQQRRALAVADQHHAASVIVVRQVMTPGGRDVVVAGLRPAGGGRARRLHQGRDGELSVHRREHPAPGGEARGLHLGDAALFRTSLHVGQLARIARDGRIDVEAVDRGGGVCAKPLHRRGADGGDDRGREIRVAGVGAPWAAQPGVSLRVVLARRRRLLGAGRRRKQPGRQRPRQPLQNPHPHRPAPLFVAEEARRRGAKSSLREPGSAGCSARPQGCGPLRAPIFGPSARAR
jgi:hypothetical protein